VPGQSHSHDYVVQESEAQGVNPGRYVDLDDNGKVMSVVPLGGLSVTRERYDTLLRAGGQTQHKAGYLPYSIVDGCQQIRKDFAYWRAAVKGAETDDFGPGGHSR
jgi:hypothetical protein